MKSNCSLSSTLNKLILISLLSVQNCLADINESEKIIDEQSAEQVINKPVNMIVKNIAVESQVAKTDTISNSRITTNDKKNQTSKTEELSREHQELAFFDYQEIPISALLRQIFSYVDKDAVGVKKLDGLTVSLSVKDVLAMDVATVVLKCHGFKMLKNGEYFTIIKDSFLEDSISFDSGSRKFDTNDCVKRHLN